MSNPLDMFNRFLQTRKKNKSYEKNLEDRIYWYSSHDSLPVVAAFCDSAEIRE